jgi:hypothetical protein
VTGVSASLFDTFERTDGSPGGHSEDSFRFLNRAAGVVWTRIRQELDGWYAAFPNHSEDLRRRFRSGSPRQHYPAWSELYLHNLMSRLGYTVTVHPDIPGSPGHPDFLVERASESFYLEAATVFSGIVVPGRREQLEAKVKDILDSIAAPEIMVKLTFERVGHSTPRTRAITEPVNAWVNTVDADQLLARSAIGPPARFTFDDWTIVLQAIPRALEYRGCPENTLLGTFGAIAGYTDDAVKLRRALTRKGKRYGTPNRPLLVAALAANGFVDDVEITNALFGSVEVRIDLNTGAQTYGRSPNGLWIGRRGPAAKRISAVLVGVGIMPMTCATAWPRLWHHFAPAHPLDAALPFASVRVVEDEVQFKQATRSAAEALGLPVTWPGPESPFARCQHQPGDHAPYDTPPADPVAWAG